MQLAGGCHCRKVQFEISVSEPLSLLICNCSICDMTAYEHLIVPEADFTLLSGKEALASYRFGTEQAEHLFCAICGIKSFYRPRSHPGCLSINFRCLDDVEGVKPARQHFDGRNWEKAKLQLR